MRGLIRIMFKYFELDEFTCSETGKNEMQEGFIHLLDSLRESCDFPFKITSGYRDRTHSAEINKTTVGQHTLGCAADIYIDNGVRRYKIVQQAILLGFKGIGIAKTFVHVDTRTSDHKVIWTY